MSDICRVEGLTFRYFEDSERNVIENAGLSFEEGKITVILGASGCGKSTLAAVMCGLYPENGGFLESGKIIVDGRDLKDLGYSERAKYISQMFQNPDLQFCMRNLREELRFCMENFSVPACEMDGKIAELSRTYHVDDLLDRPFSELSGGQKQRAALCCLFLIDPKVMVLDEPFANLDGAASEEYLKLLKTRTEKSGATVIAIDHRAAAWKGIADTFMILGEKGSLLCEPFPESELLERRDFFTENGLNDPVENTVFTPGPAKDRADKIVLENVSVFHKRNKTPVLKDVTLHAGKGEMIACVGPSGEGKTSLFMALLKQKKYKGSIKIDGRELSGIRERELFSKTGIVFQNPANQFVKLTVQDEVAVSISIWKKASEEEAKEEALELLDSYGLRPFRKFSPYMLSQGQQRRLGVLSMLAGGQEILLLDEPTYGQDGRTSKAIMEQMAEKTKEGVTVLFSTHDMSLAAAYADRIWHVKDGGAYEEY